MIGIDRTANLATYVQAVFRKEMGGMDDKLTMPTTFSLDLLEECHYAVRVIARAIRNQKRTRWSVIDYVQDLQKYGSGPGNETRRTSRFPPCGTDNMETDACVIADVNGVILMWYLPGLLSPKRQKLIWSLLSTIESRLAVKCGGGSWRVNKVHFKQHAAFGYRSGTVNYSLAWFQQGMVNKLDMEVSAELRNAESNGHQWVKAMADTLMLLGAVVSIINPGVYETGTHFIQKLKENPHCVAKNENLAALLDSWTSPYTSASLISNRDSPLHRDNSGGYSTMDLLLSIGNYSHGRFHVPGLGYDFMYTPGTVIGIVGRVLMHGATSAGDRLCFAQWNKQNVLDSLGIDATKWVNIDDLVANR